MLKRVILLSFIFHFSLNVMGHDSNIEYCKQLIQDGISLSRAREHSKSLEKLIEASNLAADNGWDKEHFLALNNIGANYSMMFDYEEAIKYYLSAFEIAIEKLDPYYENVVLNNVALLYFYELDFKKAKEFFSKVYIAAKETKVNTSLALYSINLAMVLNKTNNLEEAERLIREAKLLIENNSDLSVLANLGLAENFYLKGERKTAEIILSDLITRKNVIKNPEYYLVTLNLFTKIKIEENNWVAALQYAEIAKDVPGIIVNKITTLENLSHIHRILKNYDYAFNYKDSVIYEKNKWNEIRNQGMIASNKMKFDLLNYEKELVEKEQRINFQRKFLYVFSSGLLLLIIVISWSLKTNSEKNRQRIRIMQLELEKEFIQKLEAENRFKKAETLKKLQEEKMKNELGIKNRKLSAQALKLACRNEIIEEVLKNLLEIPEISKSKKAIKKINTLKKHLKIEEHWDEFFKHFEGVNYGFLKHLCEKHPNLTSSDIRFISYVYMNLNNKEISNLLNITVSACSKRKERLSKKLDIPEGQCLYNYLLTI